jgi:ATP-binding cassette, subfamily B, multidrug efflux pump
MDHQDERIGDRQHSKDARRLLQYAGRYKKTILLAITMLVIAVAAELTGPFIAKHMIDTHILGIEYAWYESEPGEGAVHFEGNWYKRDDRFDEHEDRGREVRIVQVERTFYFVNESLPFDGERNIEGDQLIISQVDEEATYDTRPLTASEVFSFYQPEIRPMLYLIGFYFGLLVFASFFQYGKNYLLQSAANRIIQRIRRDVFDHIQRLPIRYFDNMPAGKVVARATNDTEAIRELFVTVLATFVSSAIYLTGIFTALFILDVQLALICLTLLPILTVWIIIYRKFAAKYNHVIRARISDLNGYMNESIQGMPIIQAFGREKAESDSFEKINKEHFQYQNKLLSLNALTSHNLAGVLRNLFLVALIWYFGGASLGGGTVVSVGVIYAFVDYLSRLFNPITEIVSKLAQLEEARVAAERVFTLLDEEADESSPAKIERYRGNVRFENVSFAYKPGEYVLRNITFTAEQGQTVALVGHTGSGKSSIMNLLFRFYDIEKGKITIDGQNIQQLPKQGRQLWNLRKTRQMPIDRRKQLTYR